MKMVASKINIDAFLIYPYWNINIEAKIVKPNDHVVSNLSILEYKFICIIYYFSSYPCF